MYEYMSIYGVIYVILLWRTEDLVDIDRMRQTKNVCKRTRIMVEETIDHGAVNVARLFIYKPVLEKKV